MKLSAALSILPDLRTMINIGLWPTFVSVWQNPFLLLNPRKMSQTFMSHLWVVFGNDADEIGRPAKSKLITPHATGVVLDLGAGMSRLILCVKTTVKIIACNYIVSTGCGHAASYLDQSKVTKYVALEPNVGMHKQLRLNASKAGYTEADGTFLILSCGAAETSAILSSLDNVQVDTIISVLALCSIPKPKDTLTELVNDVLKRGAELLCYEHVLSSLEDVAWWQRFWAPVWTTWSGGCRMDRPTNVYVEEIQGRGGETVWKERNVWRNEREPEEYLFPHHVGRYIKS
jgi:hypothetical protein